MSVTKDNLMKSTFASHGRTSVGGLGYMSPILILYNLYGTPSEVGYYIRHLL